MLEHDEMDDIVPSPNVRSRRVRVPGPDPLEEVLDRLEKAQREEIAAVVRREIVEPPEPVEKK